MSISSQQPRCPRCDAHLGASSDWCTLCFLDLRPALPALPALPAPSAPSASPALESDNVPGSRGRHVRPPATAPAPTATATATVSGPGPAGETLTEEAVELMLAQLAAEVSGVPLGRVLDQLATPGRKIALMVGGSIALTVVVVLLMAAAGVLL